MEGNADVSVRAPPELAKAFAGASATVTRATIGGEAVALKVARTEADDAVLLREAAILARVKRRWGATLVASGRVPAGTAHARAGAAFLATRWIEGESLATLAASIPAEERTTLAAVVAHGVGRGLDELHGAGLRHGDVKLANVVVRRARPLRDHADDRGATLIDLGLAARSSAPLEGATPRILAPEVLAGEASSPRADLYALGIVLAEILDPAIATADDPRPLLARAFGHDSAIAPWIEALVAPSPAARPSAAWIAARAARLLGLADDEGETIESRRARVRRAYLRARGPAIETAFDPGDLDGAPREWLAAIAAVTERTAPATKLAPLDAIARKRWLVALVGPAAASFPDPAMSDAALADRLLAAAAGADPEAFTAADLASEGRARSTFAELDERDRPLALVRALGRPAPSPTIIVAAEDEVAKTGASAVLALELARALVRRGEIGRAFVALRAAGPAEEALLLRADVARRRGDREAARSLASAAHGDDARALLARIAWDEGAVDRASEELGASSSALAAEVRALVAYARGAFDEGLRALEGAGADADALGLARIEGTRGMLLHARGDAAQSHAAFARAVDLASREGALVEEATYLTGLAASAVDAGAADDALAAATRAALVWERLGRPALAARAWLSRAAAFALRGAVHDADAAAAEAKARADESSDRRAAAYAAWARVEVRAPGDPVAAAEARAADRVLADASDDDRVRAAARLLVWADGMRADGTRVDESVVDATIASRAPTARWEWWGARALGSAANARVLAAIVTLLDTAAPVASRGPALAAAIALAERLGDGDAARRLAMAQRAVVDALRAGGVSTETVRWAPASAEAPALAAAQVEQLDTIVRSLASRDRLRPLLEQVLDTLVLWTGVERGLLLLRAPDGALVPRTARNLARRDLRDEQLALSMSLAKRAMDERRPVVATDAAGEVADVHASVHALRLRSVLAVPLVARGDVLGVVYLDDRVRRGAFGPAELAWVRLVASQAAIAIADARDQALLRRAVRRAERAKAELEAALGKTEAELASARAELSRETKYRYDEIAGRSEAMRTMLHVVDRVTASDVPVLLVGESGTGKELVARAIHQNGPRSRRAFVGENCGSLPESLLETTLFGHVKGAFTGAGTTRPGLFDVADGGTLFLDEIGEMSLAMQTKLLRVLQEGEVRPVGGERVHRVDVRIVGATHRDLEAMVASGAFREDLFYRLNVVAVRVPPLRERAQDIPLLVAHFVEKHADASDPRKKRKVTRSAMDRLVAFPWPGNVRQLENEIRRALVLADDGIDVTELSDEVARGGAQATRDAGFGLKARVDALETELVRDALARTKGNQTRAAELLGISRFGLQKMMRRLGIGVAT